MDRKIDKDKRPGQKSAVFSMPNKNFRIGERAKTGLVPEKQRQDFEAQTRASRSPKEAQTTATQTSTHSRADCENQRAQPTSLHPIQSHSSGPSAFHQPSVLPQKPGPDSATTTGPASSREKSVPKIMSIVRRLLPAVERGEPWTRQRGSETEKRIWNINDSIENESKRPWTACRR